MILFLFILLGLATTLLLGSLLFSSSFFTCPQLSNRNLWLLYIFRILCSLVLAWIFKEVQFGQNDYDTYNLMGVSEQEFLKVSPRDFFEELFISNYPGGYTNVFGSHQSYWNDLAENIIVKSLALFNFFSHGNFYINNLPFAFIGFCGSIVFYKLFINYFPQSKYAVIVCCFLLPSIIVFNSNIHKDTLCFALLGFYFLAIDRLLYEGISKKYLLIALISLAWLFLFRNYIAAVLVPFTLIAFITQHKGFKPLNSFVFATLVMIILLGVMHLFYPAKSALTIIADKQQSYLKYTKVENTRLDVQPLEPTFKSFATMLPSAVKNGFFKPFPTDTTPYSLIPFMLELYAFAFALVIFYLARRKIPAAPVLYLGIFFSLAIFLIIGYSIPNLASIIRYKSIYLPLLFTPVIASLLKNKIYNK